MPSRICHVFKNSPQSMTSPITYANVRVDRLLVVTGASPFWPKICLMSQGCNWSPNELSRKRSGVTCNQNGSRLNEGIHDVFVLTSIAVYPTEILENMRKHKIKNWHREATEPADIWNEADLMWTRLHDFLKYTWKERQGSAPIQGLVWPINTGPEPVTSL